MNRIQFESLLRKTLTNPTLSVEEFVDRGDRTLLWGYNVNRESHHVYLKGGLLHVLVYRGGEGSSRDFEIVRHVSGETLDIWVDGVVHDKRLYPDACDFEACQLLKAKGFELSFTTFNDTREPEQFHGAVVGY